MTTAIVVIASLILTGCLLGVAREPMKKEGADRWDT